MNYKKCPVCGAKMESIEILKGKINTSNVVDDWAENVKKVNLEIYKCPVCEHGAIDNHLDDEFYTDFSVALGADIDDEAAVNQRSAQFEPMIQFIADNAPNTESLLEIGSGCGYLLNAAKKRFSKVLGVEPSKTEFSISKKVASGCEVINDFFGSSLELHERFSAFIATMVFEHIPDIHDAMGYAFDLLEENGVGFITVPNGQRAFRGGCYYDIYPQHLHYYSIMSLTKLARNAGFEIAFIRESENRDYLEMMVRKTKMMMENMFNDRLLKDKTLLREYISEYGKIGIWGASYAARSCVEFFDSKLITHFFDVSRMKIGKYISGFSKIIELPEKETVNENDLIIIMANEYTKDILKTLKAFDYKGKIIGFDSNGFIVEYSLL